MIGLLVNLMPFTITDLPFIQILSESFRFLPKRKGNSDKLELKIQIFLALNLVEISLKELFW